jgi:hypothetical protein
MKTLYLISFGGQFSEGYASCEGTIEQLALEWFWTDWDGKRTPVRVTVDFESMEVTVYDLGIEDGSIVYDLHKFEAAE